MPSRAASAAVGAMAVGSCCLAHQAFVPAMAPHGKASSSLRGGRAAGSSSDGSTFINALPAATLIAAAAAAANMSMPKTVRRAKAEVKKGVRVVEGREIPWNIWAVKAPYTAKVVENDVHPHTLTKETGDANWETAHVTIDTDGNLPYVEGQSMGVISPGPDKNGKTPAKIRLYSIASSAVGDDQTKKTVSLCVKRVVEVEGDYSNREVGEDKPDKAGTAFPDKKVYRGVCSNFVCDLYPGDEVKVTGPTGAEMLLPQEDDANLIMLATGTGIAPMRSYMRLLFHDKAGANADGSRKFKGVAWLFLGVPYSNSLLYVDEHDGYLQKYPDQFRVDYAVSREQKNAAGQKMYIQTKMAEFKDDLWDLMQKEKTHVYMCGLKGMEKGMEECFGDKAEAAGMTWKEFSKKMKKADRYHVEVY